MEDLIKAMQILRKYGNPDFPTHCEYYILHVNISPDLVSEEDKKALEELHFFVDQELDGFSSDHFGAWRK